MEAIDRGKAERLACLDMLMARFGIDSALVNVPKLARALGLGASTIYAYMNAGTFFLPFRRVNGSPMVKVDDLIGWYLDAGQEVKPATRAIEQAKPAACSPEPAAATAQPAAFKFGEPHPARRGRRVIDAAELGRNAAPIEPWQVATKEGLDSVLDGIAARAMAKVERHRKQLRT